MWNSRLPVLCAVLISLAISATGQDWFWTWRCNEQTLECKRDHLTQNNNETGFYPSVEVCRLLCENNGGLWPIPTGQVTIGHDVVPFHTQSLRFNYTTNSPNVQAYMDDLTKLFENQLSTDCLGPYSKQAFIPVTINLVYSSSDLDLKWYTDESYSLDLFMDDADTEIFVEIIGKTVFGVRHGLETLSQLIVNFDSSSEATDYCSQQHVIIKEAKITDAPVFTHRGLLLDSARNFMPIATIKRQINGMGASKMNYLHWHATDSQSFPLVVPTIANITRNGAYSRKQIYTPSDLEDLIWYALLRGVRIILEFDGPSHAGQGWQWGPEAGLGNLAVCINKQPWRSFCIQPPCGQLNPANPNLYGVLSQLFKNVQNIFKNTQVFHMGGDEVFFPCWNSSLEIINYLESQGKGSSTADFLDLWSEYQNKALESWDASAGHSNTKIILWTSKLTDLKHIENYLDQNRYVIQTWVPGSSSLPNKLLAKGYQLVISTKDAWYLDHGFWGTTQYYQWTKVYSNKIPKQKGVLGGEVCMWSEYVDNSGVDSRIWPRAAAAAERLWSDPSVNMAEVRSRFYQHRSRLLRRGVAADALGPQWCMENDGECEISRNNNPKMGRWLYI